MCLFVSLEWEATILRDAKKDGRDREDPDTLGKKALTRAAGGLRMRGFRFDGQLAQR